MYGQPFPACPLQKLGSFEKVLGQGPASNGAQNKVTNLWCGVRYGTHTAELKPDGRHVFAYKHGGKEANDSGDECTPSNVSERMLLMAKHDPGNAGQQADRGRYYAVTKEGTWIFWWLDWRSHLFFNFFLSHMYTWRTCSADVAELLMLLASLLMIVTLPFTYPLDGINLSKLGELGVDLLFDPCVSLIPSTGQNSGISKSAGFSVHGTPKNFAR